MPACSASQSIAGVTSSCADPSDATYSSVRLQVEISAASGATFTSRSRKPRNVGDRLSGANASRPRRSSGAVV
jgi:hypothetical protein